MGYAQRCVTVSFVDVVQRGNYSDGAISLMLGITIWTHFFFYNIAITIILMI